MTSERWYGPVICAAIAGAWICFPMIDDASAIAHRGAAAAAGTAVVAAAVVPPLVPVAQVIIGPFVLAITIGIALAASADPFGLAGEALSLAVVAAVLFGSRWSRVSPNAWPVLAVPALVVGLRSAEGGSDIAVPIAVLAVAAAVAGHSPASIALLALAAADIGAPSAGALLAAAAVLSGAIHLPQAAGLALPGGIELALAIEASEMTVGVVVVAVASAAAAVLLVMRRYDPAIGLDPRALPAVALGAWLLVAPSTWTWTGVTGLSHYDRGAATALGVVALVSLTGMLFGQMPVPVSNRR